MAIREPEVTLNIIPARTIITTTEHRTLMVGQKLDTGTATPKVLIQNFPNDKSEDALFGKRSHLAAMVRAFKRENSKTPLDIIPIADPPAVPLGNIAITFADTAAVDGVLEVSVVSATQHKYTIAVSKDDTAAAVAQKVKDAADLDEYSPFLASLPLSGTVKFTSEHKGVLVENWGVKVDGEVSGLTFDIGDWTDQTGTPDITNIEDQIANIRYQTVVWPASYSIDSIQSDFDAKFNTPNKILDGVIFQTQVNSLASLEIYLAARNSQSVVVICQKYVDRQVGIKHVAKGPSSFEMPDSISSQFAGIRALRLTADEDISQYVTTNAPKDQFGGAHICTLPYFNTLMPNMPVSAPNDEFTDEELRELYDNGGATVGPNIDYNNTIMGTIVTTYLKDNASNPDDSYHFLNTVDTASFIRYFYYINSRARYSQTRLTSGDLKPGFSMANLPSIRAYYNRLYKELAGETITVEGSEALRDFNENLVLEADYAKGEVTVAMAPLLVGQLRVILGTIQINFQD